MSLLDTEFVGEVLGGGRMGEGGQNSDEFLNPPGVGATVTVEGDGCGQTWGRTTFREDVWGVVVIPLDVSSEDWCGGEIWRGGRRKR